jgi:hypothetical protein
MIIQACQTILYAYIEHLFRTNQYSQIALYTAALPVHLQASTYAQFIKSVKEKEKRAQSLADAGT